MSPEVQAPVGIQRMPAMVKCSWMQKNVCTSCLWPTGLVQKVNWGVLGGRERGSDIYHRHKSSSLMGRRGEATEMLGQKFSIRQIGERGGGVRARAGDGGMYAFRGHYAGVVLSYGCTLALITAQMPRSSNIGGSGDRAAGGISPLLGGRAAPQCTPSVRCTLINPPHGCFCMSPARIWVYWS